MRNRGVRWLATVLALALLAAVFPGAATGASGEWTRAGGKLWLKRDQGVNFRTGGAGDDLRFDGDYVYAKYGMQFSDASQYVDLDLVPPTDGWTFRLDANHVAYHRLVVLLKDGLAQVNVGSVSSSGLINTGMYLEDWAVMDRASAAPAPSGTGSQPVGGAAAKLWVDSANAEMNGSPAALDVGPRRIGGAFMVPLRFVAQALGLNTLWDSRKQLVTVGGQGVMMTFWINGSSAQINGRTVQLDHAAVLVEDRLMVPLSALTTALGDKVQFDQSTGEIRLGGSSSAVASPAPNPGPSSGVSGSTHFSAVWLNRYENGYASKSSGAKPDFYLTLNPDGTARVVLTITGLIGATFIGTNLEYKGTYTLDPLRVELTLQPAPKGWSTSQHLQEYWQTMTVTGDLAADWSRIDNLYVQGAPAESGYATPVKRVPDPGPAR